jgi:multicomponent Na+:H+ antiporter subunit D
MYVLIVGGIVTSLLTLYTLMRAWNLAFWREDDDHTEETGVVERIEYLGAAPAADDQSAAPRHSAHHDRDDRRNGRRHRRADVFAGPLYALCASIGDALLTPVTLVQLEQEGGR